MSVFSTVATGGRKRRGEGHTRREEILMSRDELNIVWKLRRVMGALEAQQSIELLLDRLKQTRSNAEFLMQVQKTTPVPGRSDDD